MGLPRPCPVEFFSIISRKVLRNGNFASRDDLINKRMRFITDYDTTAKPTAWTYTGDPLKTDHTRSTSARQHEYLTSVSGLSTIRVELVAPERVDHRSTVQPSGSASNLHRGWILV